MLEVRINEKETMINVCGHPTEIMADIVEMLKVIYDRVETKNKEFFEKSLKKIVEERVYAKSQKELEELNEKEMKKAFNKMLKENPEELLKKLKDLLK